MAATTNSTIARALLADLSAGTSLQQLTTSVAAYLVEERRQGDARSILREIERLLLDEQGILYVHVTSAHSLSDEQKQQIVGLFITASGAKSVKLEETINKDVIGGVRCETADHRLDLTVRRQLQQLKTARA